MRVSDEEFDNYPGAYLRSVSGLVVGLITTSEYPYISQQYTARHLPPNHSKSYVYSLNYPQELQQYTARFPFPPHFSFLFFSLRPRTVLTPHLTPTNFVTFHHLT